MTRVFALLLLLSALLAGCAQGPADADRPPNIVFILADDMGLDAVSHHNPQGMGPLRTPHIDALIAQGMTFTDAHSGSAVCTPTRYGLLTGRYAWRTELTSEVLWDYGRPLIEDERLTVAELLQRHGYHTGMVGKWHLGFDWHDADGNLANDQVRIKDAIWREGNGSADRIRACIERIDYSRPLTGGPTDHGFDFFFGVDLPNFSPYAWISQDRLTAMPTDTKPEEMFGTDGPMVPGWQLEDLLPTLAARSAQYIHEQSEADEPFFLYVPLTSPHTPISPSAPFQGVSEITPYADFLIETDWVVGHILEALDEAGVADDTLVIFTTDNGTAAACNFNQLREHGVDLRLNYRAQKGSIYDGGHRVPFVARWPGVIEAGTTCDQVVCLNDFMATTADLLDADLPEDAAEDSTSILPLLTGEADTLPNRPAVVHHDYRGNFAIRDGRWKLVLVGGGELYDMDADPKETTNLAEANPEVVARLRALLQTYRESGRSTPAGN